MARVRLAFTFSVDLEEDEFRLIQTALKRKLEGADVAAAKELAARLGAQHQQAVDIALGRGDDGGDMEADDDKKADGQHWPPGTKPAAEKVA